MTTPINAAGAPPSRAAPSTIVIRLAETETPETLVSIAIRSLTTESAVSVASSGRSQFDDPSLSTATTAAAASASSSRPTTKRVGLMVIGEVASGRGRAP